MAQIKLFVGLPDIGDTARQLGVSRRLLRKPSVLRAFEKAEEILSNWMRRRFISLSASGGGGKWRDIKESTKKRKRQKAKQGQATAKPTWIMRENDNILLALDTKKNRFGKRGFWIGILKDRAHSHSKLSVGNLAKLHNPIWPIVEQPPPQVIEQVQAPVIRAMRMEQAREARKDKNKKAPTPTRAPRRRGRRR